MAWKGSNLMPNLLHYSCFSRNVSLNVNVHLASNWEVKTTKPQPRRARNDTYEEEKDGKGSKDEEGEESRDGSVDQLLIGAELVLDLGLGLVVKAGGARGRVGGGALDLNVAEGILVRLFDLGSTNQEGHCILACSIFELGISLVEAL